MIQTINKPFEQAKEDVMLQLMTEKMNENPYKVRRFYRYNRKHQKTYESFLESCKEIKSDVSELFMFTYENNKGYLSGIFCLKNNDGEYSVDIESFKQGIIMVERIARKNGYSVAFRNMEKVIPKDQWNAILTVINENFISHDVIIYS